MGIKESKIQDARGARSGEPMTGLSGSSSRHHGRLQSNSRNRSSRADLSGFLPGGNATTSGSQDPPYERRETRQEREARKLEKERILRAKERERSMREEHVDGGFLVTLGTYVGPEDFSKQVVRQLQVCPPLVSSAEFRGSVPIPDQPIHVDREKDSPILERSK